jgi:hypothetical protein
MNPAEKWAKYQREIDEILDSRLTRKAAKTKISSSIEKTKLYPDPEQITIPKKKYQKIVVPVPLSVMSEEESDQITQQEIKQGNVFPSTYQEEVVRCKQLLSQAIQQTKALCRKIINQYPSDSSSWRKAKQKCKDEFGDVPDVAEYLDTFRSTSKKKSEIQKWVWEINNECSGKLDKVLIVLDYIHRNRLKRNEGYKMSKGQKVSIPALNKKTQKIEDKQFDPVVFHRDKKQILTDLHNNGLKIGEQMLDKYIRWFVKKEIITRMGKAGSRGESVYCIGYWSDSKDDKGQRHENPIAFYRVQAWRDQYDKAFRNFTVNTP